KKSTLAVISKNPIQQAFAGFVRPPEIATAHNAADITNSCSQISHYYNKQVQYLYKKALRRIDRLKAEVDNQQERLSVDAPSETASQPDNRTLQKRAQSLQEQAGIWHGKMEEHQKQYDKEGPDLQRMVNVNLQQFDQYLDTLTLHGKFTWPVKRLFERYVTAASLERRAYVPHKATDGTVFLTKPRRRPRGSTGKHHPKRRDSSRPAAVFRCMKGHALGASGQFATNLCPFGNGPSWIDGSFYTDHVHTQPALGLLPSPAANPSQKDIHRQQQQQQQQQQRQQRELNYVPPSFASRHNFPNPIGTLGVE
ncbi:hypothetical protein RHOSPDRAFT_27951, partial [Rhodotorula sp. JG-1b]